jgi:hypothetical protein
MAVLDYLPISRAFLIAMDRRVARFVRAAESHNKQAAQLGRVNCSS